MEKSGKSNLHHYKKFLQPYAQKLRNRMTKAEACLWKYALRASMMKGYEFRRQRPVLNFIADFMCLELNLVIEVDGGSHLWEETIKRDIRKNEALNAVGITVLRFTNEEVLQDMRSVIQRIEWWIERYEEKHGVVASPLPP